MYKTVRQGDASLHYTILPQIDEFHVYDVSSVRGSPPFKCHHCEEEEDDDDTYLQPSPRVVCCMGIVLMIIITITCCIIATHFIDTLIRSPCVVTTSQTTVSVTGEMLMPKGDLLAESERVHDIATQTTTSSEGFGVSRMVSDDRVLSSLSKSSTLSPTSLKKEPANFEIAITGKMTSRAAVYDHVTIAHLLQVVVTSS